MNANEKIYIRHYDATTTEDVFDKGEIGKSLYAWDGKDNPVDGRFNSVPDALAAVCAKNYFTNYPNSWTNWGKEFGQSEKGRFSFSVLVDANNCEASKGEIEKWKRGEMRLWDCTLNVYLGVCAERDLTESEVMA